MLCDIPYPDLTEGNLRVVSEAAGDKILFIRIIIIGIVVDQVIALVEVVHSLDEGEGGREY